MSAARSSSPLLASDTSQAQEPTSAVGQAARRRRLLSRRAGLITALGLAALIGGSVVGINAWHATQLREAYLPELQVQVRQHPFDGRLLAVYAARLAQARRFAEAADACQRAIAAGENTPQMWLTWAASTAAAGDRTQAGSILLLGMRQPALSGSLHVALDRCRPLPPNASPLALAAAICPSGPQTLLDSYTRGSFWNGLFAWYGHLHPGSSGSATREDWAKAEPNNPQAQILWAVALLRNGRYAEAEAAGRRAVTLSPNSPAAHLALGDALYHEGNIGKAGLEYVQVAKAHHDSLRALLGLGQVTLDKKMLPMSLDVFGKAVKLDPKSADAWVGYGKAEYNASLDLSTALSAFENAAKLAPNRTDFYPTYANTLRAQSRYPEAEALLRKRLAAAPNDAISHYYLALTLLAYNVTPARQAEAEQALRRSLEIEPQGVSVRARLGRLLVDERRPQEAIPYLESALSLDPHDAAAALALARGYRAAGRLADARAAEARIEAITRYATAVKDLEDSIKLHPQDPTLYVRLANLYAGGGENDKAARYRDAALMLERDPKHAVAGMNILRQASDLGTPLPERPKETP